MTFRSQQFTPTNTVRALIVGATSGDEEAWIRMDSGDLYISPNEEVSDAEWLIKEGEVLHFPTLRPGDVLYGIATVTGTASGRVLYRTRNLP